MTTPPQNRVTLGSLMTTVTQAGGLSEPMIAAGQYVPDPVRVGTGIGTPLDSNNPDVAGIHNLKTYGKRNQTSNTFHGAEYPEDNPPLSRGEISQYPFDANVKFFTNSNIWDVTYRTNFLNTSYGMEEGLDRDIVTFTKNSLAEDNPDIQTTGHGVLTHVIAATDYKTYGHTTSADKRPGDTSEREYGDRGFESPLQRSVYDLLVRRNRFHPTDNSPYLNYKSSGEGAFSKGLYSVQRELGKFSKDAPHVNIRDLRQVGARLLMRAQSISNDSSNSIAKDLMEGNFSFLIDGMILWPHATQNGGGTVDVLNLRARVDKTNEFFAGYRGELGYSAQDDLIAVQGFDKLLGFGAEDPPFDSELSVPTNADSFGTMNSPIEPFSGPFPAGMAVPVFIGLLIIFLLSFLFENTLLATFKKDTLSTGPIPEQPWTLPLGRRYPKSFDFFGELMTLYGFSAEFENQPFFSRMMLGMMLFFGLDEPISPLSMPGPDWLETSLDLVYAPGFYLVMIKGILRDMDQIVQAFIDIGKINSVTAIIGAFFNIMEKIFSSYFFRFMSTMANLGLVAGTGQWQPGHVHGSDYLTPEQQRSQKLTAYNRLQLTRAFEGTQKGESALSLSRFPSFYLPTEPLTSVEVHTLEDITDEKPLSVLKPTMIKPGKLTTTNRRLSPEAVEKIEALIDEEYVPFSVQDLRTNEIISLPAFIENISDDFQVEYSTSHGFGRTDPVHTYAKTVRNIGLTFSLVAMNEKDHEYLYFILNKLTSMCYPQRDAGLTRKGEDNLFTQPFSQSPTSSPVVRIRVGDLLKSNKSGLALKKLFGGDETLGLKPTTESEKVREESGKLRKLIDEALYKKADLKNQMITGFAAGEEDTVKGKRFLVKEGAMIAAEDGGKYAIYRNRIPFVATVAKLHKWKSVNGTVKLGAKETSKAAKEIAVFQMKPEDETMINDFKDGYAFGGAALAGVIARKKAGGGALNPFAGPDPVEIFIKSSGVADVEPLIDSATFGAVDANLDEARDLTDDFMEGNPVVDAFRRSEGKGLAGVITQMSLSYEQAKWGSNRAQHLRAPQHVKITLSFSPIHDMPLGLDHSGQLFAPTHPVGIMSAERLDDAYKSIRLPEDSINRLKNEATTARDKIKAQMGVLKDEDLEDPSSTSLF